MGTGAGARVLGASEYVYRRTGVKNREQSLEGATEEHYVDLASDEVKNAPMGPDAQLAVVPLDLRGDKLARRAGEVALNAYRVLGCRNAGRIDLRYGDKGAGPFILEVCFIFFLGHDWSRAFLTDWAQVNPIPGIIEGWGDSALFATNNGLKYEDFIREILESAFKRAGTSRTAIDRGASAVDCKGDKDIENRFREARWETYNLRT